MRKDLLWPIGGGGVVGVLIAIWSYYQAQAAIKVRPRLNDVDFVTAFLTGHGTDWLYYFHPALASALTIIVIVVVLTISWEVV